MITLITQRTLEWQGKRIDALEQNYVKYLNKFGFNLIPVPNNKEYLDFYLKLPVEAIILTGGGDVGDDLSKERDDIEKTLLDFAVKSKIPILGICRGAQFINTYFGGKIKSISDISNQNHVAVTHDVEIIDGNLNNIIGDIIKTNSYHEFGFKEKDLATNLKTFARSDDGIVEGLNHRRFPIAGILWHPERENPGNESDKIIEAFANKNLFWKK